MEMERYNDMMNPHDFDRLNVELRGGRIMGLFVALLGVVLILVLWLMDLTGVMTRVWVGVIAGGLSLMVCWLSNRKIRLDLRMGVKLVMPKRITDLTEEPMEVAWDVTKQASKHRGMLYYVHVGKLKFAISRNQYERMRVGGECELCFGANSRVFLEVRTKEL